ncbi:MAG TPA: hypothetical protein VGD74_01645 [Vulgatibacter sp.]
MNGRHLWFSAAVGLALASCGIAEEPETICPIACGYPALISLEPPIDRAGDYSVSISEGAKHVECEVAVPLTGADPTCTMTGSGFGPSVEFVAAAERPEVLDAIRVFRYARGPIGVAIRLDAGVVAEATVEPVYTIHGDGPCSCGDGSGTAALRTD